MRHIIAPNGPPIDERPPVLSEQELYEQYAAKRELKLANRAVRDAEIQKATEAERAAKLERRARREEWEKSRVEAREKRLGEVRGTFGDVD